MLLRCCLIHVTIIILRYILYLVYLCPCLGLFMFYLCDLFSIFCLIFIVINHVIFVRFLEHLVSFLDEKSKHLQLVEVQFQGVV